MCVSLFTHIYPLISYIKDSVINYLFKQDQSQRQIQILERGKKEEKWAIKKTVLHTHEDCVVRMPSSCNLAAITATQVPTRPPIQQHGND